jgi:hypothetical protein
LNYIYQENQAFETAHSKFQRSPIVITTPPSPQVTAKPPPQSISPLVSSSTTASVPTIKQQSVTNKVTATTSIPSKLENKKSEGGGGGSGESGFAFCSSTLLNKNGNQGTNISSENPSKGHSVIVNNPVVVVGQTSSNSVASNGANTSKTLKIA